MDYNDVPLFVRVVEAGSFTAAAVALGREKSSVSRGIARLEEELGVRLLQRTTRRLGLTDAGQAFFERVRGAVAGVDEAATAVQELGAEPRGIVRVTAFPGVDGLGLPEAIAAFGERYPKIQVEFTLTGRTVDLVAEGIDLAVRAGKMADSTLVARKIGSSDMALFAAPAYLARRGRPEKLQDLALHCCVLFRGRGGRATWTFLGPEGEETVDVTGSVSADDIAFLARTAAAGAGVALLPILSVREYLERGSLELVLPDYRVTGSAVHLVLPSSTFVPARVALLGDFLFERLSREMAEATRRCTAREDGRKRPRSADARVKKRR